MSEQVKRYDLNWEEMEEFPDDEYVLYSDFASLCSQLATDEARILQLEEDLRRNAVDECEHGHRFVVDEGCAACRADAAEARAERAETELRRTTERLVLVTGQRDAADDFYRAVEGLDDIIRNARAALPPEDKP